jgi:hypothetical protein
MLNGHHELIRRCEVLWDTIKVNNPNRLLPSTVVISIVDTRGLIFPTNPVMVVCMDAFRTDGLSDVPQICLSSHLLQASSPGDAIAVQLLHAATHIHCHNLGIYDMSKNSVYHNRRFRYAAWSLGLAVEYTGVGTGFTTLELTGRSKDALSEPISAIDDLVSKHLGVSANPFSSGRFTR